MKIASWNVNSLRVRLPQVLAWLEDNPVDVLALQETKTQDSDFPIDEILASGYQAVFSGQKTYNGVAIIARTDPKDPVTDIADLDDPQRRILAATVGGVRVIDLYVVNGSEVGSEKFDYKLSWLNKVTRHIEKELEQYDKLIVLGDFNIAPDDRDVHDPERWHEKILCSTPEREALNTLLNLGLIDTFRQFDQDERVFSWWDYRGGGFRRNHGLRIDLILANQTMSALCKSSYVDVGPRSWERPSDHAPVVADFDSE